MFKFSDISKQRLSQVHPALQQIMNEIIKFVNIGITCGKRTMEEQKKLVSQGKSQTLNSRHIPKKEKGMGNEEFSRAVDIVWYNNHRNKYDYSTVAYRVLGPAIVQLGKQMGHNIRWGGDWDQDQDYNDQSFMDLVHFEINE